MSSFIKVIEKIWPSALCNKPNDNEAPSAINATGAAAPAIKKRDVFMKWGNSNPNIADNMPAVTATIIGLEIIVFIISLSKELVEFSPWWKDT